jgi:rRNA processing protein Gar1
MLVTKPATCESRRVFQINYGRIKKIIDKIIQAEGNKIGVLYFVLGIAEQQHKCESSGTRFDV